MKSTSLTLGTKLSLVTLICTFTLLNYPSFSAYSQQKNISSKKKKKRKKVKLPEIDLSNWKVTLPVTNDEGKPYEIEPPEMHQFASNEIAKPYMYIDSTRGAIVFHAMPTESTTKNTKYTRSELREQMVPGDNNVNWKFSDGAYMKGKIAIDQVTGTNQTFA